MKTINLLITMLLCATFSFAQTPSLPIDFDDTADDAFVGEGGAVYSLETTLFTPDNVAKIVGGTDEWNSRIDLELGTYIDMTTANKTFTFDFYTSEAVVMNGLFQISNEENGGYPIEMPFTTDGAIGWETITLDFTTATNGYPNAGEAVVYGQYAKLSVFTNFGDVGSSTYYVDDIAGAANGIVVPVVAAPATAATAPTALSTDVISVYSGAYANNIATNLNPGWGQTTSYSTVTVEDDEMLKYGNLNYQGLEYTSSDVSAMEYVHLDYWTADATALSFYLIAGGENAYDIAATDGIVIGEWVSLDIPLTFFSEAGRDLTAAFQFKTVGDGTVYLDNLYFWRNTPVADFEAPTGFTATLGDVTHNSVEFLFNATDNSGNLTYSIVYGEDSVTTTGTSGTEKSYVLEGLEAETAYAFSVRAFDASENVASNNPIALNTTTVAASEVSYCMQSTTHFNIEAETASEIYLTIEKIDATSMYVEIQSATDDPVDLLLVNGSGSSDNVLDDSVTGKLKRTLTFSSTPTEVSFEILWSKITVEGNWQLNTFTVPFDMTCDSGEPTKLNAISNIELAVYPNPTSGDVYIDAANGSVVNIYNITGQLKVQRTLQGGMLSLGDLENGVYFVKVNNQVSRVIKK